MSAVKPLIRVRQARDFGQDQLAVLVALIISHFPRPDDLTDRRARAGVLTTCHQRA